LMIGIGQNDSNIVAPEKEASLITNLILWQLKWQLYRRILLTFFHKQQGFCISVVRLYRHLVEPYIYRNLSLNISQMWRILLELHVYLYLVYKKSRACVRHATTGAIFILRAVALSAAISVLIFTLTERTIFVNC
jgi:hypothetical protein